MLLEAAQPLSHDDAGLYSTILLALRKGDHAAELALLLLLATGTEYINIRLVDPLDPVQFAQDDRWAGRYGNVFAEFLLVLVTGATLNGAQSKLARVHCLPPRNEVGFTYVDYHLAGLFMRLPSLQSFSFERAKRTSPGHEWQGHVGASSIKRLELTNCIMDDFDIVCLLTFCKELEEVSIRWTESTKYDHTMMDDDQFEFNASVISIGPSFRQISKALEAHASSLRMLVLDTMTTGPVLMWPSKANGSCALGSLRSFIKLESLELDDTVLTGASDEELSADPEDVSKITAELVGLLPTSVKVFTIRTRKSLASYPEILSSIAQNSLESLKRLRVEFPASLETSIGRSIWPGGCMKSRNSTCMLSSDQNDDSSRDRLTSVKSMDCGLILARLSRVEPTSKSEAQLASISTEFERVSLEVEYKYHDVIAWYNRARLASLYSDFRNQRSSNPDGYEANSSAWLRALTAAANAGLIPTQKGTEHDQLILNTSEELARALQTPEYGRPLALGAAIEDGLRKKELIQLREFLDAKRTVYSRSWIPTPLQVINWGLRQIGLVGEGTDDKLVAGNLVIMANVEAASKAVLEKASTTATSNTSRVFSKDLFTSTFSSAAGADALSSTDLSVLLTHLSRDRSAIAYSPSTGTVKFKAPSEHQPSPITDEDISIAKLRTLIQSLEPQIQHLTARIAELDKIAREAVTNKQLASAKSALRSKKLADTNLQSRTATFTQLEEVYSKIEQAADQVEIVRVMEASSKTLASLNKQTGGVEKVQDVMDSVRDEMMSADEIGSAINDVSAGEIDEGEVDDELEALEKVEREKQEEVERKEREKQEEAGRRRASEEAEKTREKLAELDQLGRSQTPVASQFEDAQESMSDDTNNEPAKDEAAVQKTKPEKATA